MKLEVLCLVFRGQGDKREPTESRMRKSRDIGVLAIKKRRGPPGERVAN